MNKMMMILALLSLLAFAPEADAFLSRSDTTSLKISLYGLYTTSDPTCLTGLVPTIPLAATPTLWDFASSPTLGSGPVASPVNCMVFVVGNYLYEAWSPAATTYATTTPTGFSPGYADDSACDAGGNTPATGPASMLAGHCDGAVLANQVAGNGDCFVMTWPTRIAADMQALSLPMDTFVNVNTSAMLFFVSVDSGCTMNTVADQGVVGCNGQSSMNPMAPPTAPGDTQHGIKLSGSVAQASKYVFYIDTDNTVGGCSPQDTACPSNSNPNAASCSNQSAPIFGFRAARAGE